MLQAILVWTGAVLALGLLLVMALGPVIVEVDQWRYERRHNRRSARGRAAVGKAIAPEPAAAVAPPVPSTRVAHHAA
jgi:hypothetical protein